MRNLAIALNSIVAAFFACFLLYTFIARQHLDAFARVFVTEKTLHYSEPIVALTDESLDSPAAKKLLSDKQSAAIRHEITEYRNDPSGYIADLTRQKMLAANPKNPNPLSQQAASIKERIRSFYDNTLAVLIRDLRIFSTSNLCASLIAIGLAYWSRKNIQKSIVWFSFLMFVTVLYCSYLYVDDLTFFCILFRTHMGWWYPLFLCVILAGLYLDYGRAAPATEQIAQPNREQDSSVVRR
ncbi:MAG: hypothetical protein JWM11_5721 [Planctomycetaceae bacterium]|nr:hypothetical protein [Planctomycetaceae bacterium]